MKNYLKIFNNNKKDTLSRIDNTKLANYIISNLYLYFSNIKLLVKIVFLLTSRVGIYG